MQYTNDDLAAAVDALALTEPALEAFRRGWHQADDQGHDGGRVAAGLLAIGSWLKESQPMSEFDTVTDLRVCTGRIEDAFRRLRKHRLVAFANAPGGTCTCGSFILREGGEEGESLWLVHLAVAVAGCSA